VPSAGAAMVCSIFIASITASAWPLLHLVAGLDGERDHLARHRRGQAAAFGLAPSPACASRSIDHDLRGAGVGEHVIGLAQRVDRAARVRLAGEVHLDASPGARSQRPASAVPTASTARRRAGRCSSALVCWPPKSNSKRRTAHAMRAPAVAAAERVVAGQRLLVQQRLGHGGSRASGSRPAAGGTAPPARAGSAPCRGRPARTSGSSPRGAGTARWWPGRRCASAPAPRPAAPAPLRGGAMHDQLGDHRVVVRRDRIALAHAVVDAHRPRSKALPAACGRRAACRWPAGSCCRGSRRRCAPRSHGRGCAGLVLLQRQRLAGSDAQLPLDQVEAGDGFGHRMLHLQPRVHLHEEELHLGPRCSTMNSTVPAPT
jgi:hypothetical protein